jgi:hypothetical protein
MKGRAEKEHDTRVAVMGAVEEKFEGIRALFHGLKRFRREYVAVESIDFEPLPGGQTLVLRMLYPYEMVRVELADQQIEELINRAQGLTANGALIATDEQTAAILGTGIELGLGNNGG